jgi:hypothetical protein
LALIANNTDVLVMDTQMGWAVKMANCTLAWLVFFVLNIAKPNTIASHRL